MEHLKFDLGYLQGGSTVTVTLKNQANVRVLDSSNYRSYASGRRHQFYGGRATRSPFSVSVPRSGHWILAVDLGGNAGRIEASVSVNQPRTQAS